MTKHSSFKADLLGAIAEQNWLAIVLVALGLGMAAATVWL